MKTILITGATDGIGFAAASSLLAKGHSLLVHGRSPEKLKNTIERLKQIAPSSTIKGYCADLSAIDNVHRLVADIRQDFASLDVVINNAGVFKVMGAESLSGIDVRFNVNVISPYILSNQLLPILAQNGRIVNVSSAAQARVNIDALVGKESINDAFQAYAQSKSALTICSQEMAQLTSNEQVVVSVNPGSLLATNMVKSGFGIAGNDIAIGSDILVRAAVAEEFADANGKYYDNDNKQFAVPLHGAEDKAHCNRVMQALSTFI